MDYLNQLEDYIEEYIKEEDKKRIPFIAIHIPQYKEDFLVSDSWRLMTSFLGEVFTLVVKFSVRKDTRKGKALLKKAEDAGLFLGFIRREDNKRVSFLKETNNDKKTIVALVATIITTLFPLVQAQEIKVELKRLDSWFTLEE